ncbi:MULTISPECIES: hypothetical protein [Paraburkholderia]|uniref:Transcriptional regulator n=1 Tax=Paraburkholderia madseniana TaxID=2599607 RepID=A0AAP5ETK9_9BURK|nr:MULTISPECIES: hypothetical protein [Paraburkholderia]MCX4143938.1 hypothetical protein [Paraburkholderia madseniana]MCX4170959.1 hypothetical protein [Paraburkholderia madseniana]MDN7146892.1 hypothetical protein [Paraburkholderia sp. WS6]MDQ6405772.1 hypothetical protein [Paraburkholderia madseniana]MDQ6458971.1 hypothetical protein [Paraburkholderia madseniana]
MWVRAVATAVAVWCVSGAAMAAGYAEVWNPPESTGHAAKHAKKTTGAAKVKSTAGAKTGSKQAAKGQHGAQRVASVSKSGAKPAAHGSVKKVAARNVGHGGVVKGAGKPKSKAAVVAQGKKPHAQLAQAKSGQGRIMHADLVQGHAAHAKVVNVTAKTSVAKPAVVHTKAPAKAANVAASPAATAPANLATASSGSLPPILH